MSEVRGRDRTARQAALAAVVAWLRAQPERLRQPEQLMLMLALLASIGLHVLPLLGIGAWLASFKPTPTPPHWPEEEAISIEIVETATGAEPASEAGARKTEATDTPPQTQQQRPRAPRKARVRPQPAGASASAALASQTSADDTQAASEPGATQAADEGSSAEPTADAAAEGQQGPQVVVVTDPFGSFEMPIAPPGSKAPNLKLGWGAFEQVMGAERLAAERTPRPTVGCTPGFHGVAWTGSIFHDLEQKLGIDRWGGHQPHIEACPWSFMTHISQYSETDDDRFLNAAFDAEGNVYAVGQWVRGEEAVTVLAKLDAQRDFDATFGQKGQAFADLVPGIERFSGIVVQASGDVVVAGEVAHPGGDTRDRDLALARFHRDGSLDGSFGDHGLLRLDLSDGVAHGSAYFADAAWNLVRDDADRLVLHGASVRSDGTGSDFALVRLTANGARDESFGDHGVRTLSASFDGIAASAQARDVTVLPRHAGLVAVGYRNLADGRTGPVLYKVDDRGQLDTAFGDHGIVHGGPLSEPSEQVFQAIVQPNLGGPGYKLVITGDAHVRSQRTTDIVSWRLTEQGELDTTFGNNGLVFIDVAGHADHARGAVLLPDRRLVLIGAGQLTPRESDGLVAVLTPDGEPDLSYGKRGFRLIHFDGASDFLWSGTLSPDHTVLAMAGAGSVREGDDQPANEDALLLMMHAPN